MLSCFTSFLLFPVLRDRIGVFCAVLLPVIRVAAAPFLRTVPAHQAVLFVCLQFLLSVFNPPPLLTIHLTANRLPRLVLRGLKSLLTTAATPFSHTGPVSTQRPASSYPILVGQLLPCNNVSKA